MQRFKNLNKRRLLIAFIAALLCNGLYRVYLYNHDREQYEDGNLLITVVFLLVVGVAVYTLLGLVTKRTAGKK